MALTKKGLGAILKNYFLKILCKILQKCGIFELAKLKNCKINNLTQHIPHLDKSKTTNWCTLSFIITISILLTRVWGIWTIVITLKQRHVELCNQSTQDFLFKRFGRNEKKEIKNIYSLWLERCFCEAQARVRQGSARDGP